MTSQSVYHYVQSSSRLLEDDEADEISLDENLNKNDNSKVEFFQNDNISDQKEYENNKAIHQKRHRALSISSDEKRKVNKPHDSIGNLPQNLEFFETKKPNQKRRTNSFNEIELPQLSNQIDGNKHNQQRISHSVIDKTGEIKASFVKILNAGKQKIPNPTQFAQQFQHSISVQSVKSNKKPSDSMAFRYSRSQSYNQNQEFQDDENVFHKNDEEFDLKIRDYDDYIKSNESNLNYLSKSLEDKTNTMHNQFKKNLYKQTPLSVAEEVSLSTSSSTSQSSTPSSSISKTQIGNEDHKKKNLIDQNNNNMTESHENELIRLQDLKLTRQKNDSIRMRHNSFKTNHTGKADFKTPPEFVAQTINNKNCILVNEFDSTSSDDGQVVISKRNRRNPFNNYFVIILLFVINLLNYIDRYTLAGVLVDVQKFFDINDGESGFLQTAFICSYMILAPLFGYLGDRYPRKWLIVFGVTFWSFMTLLGSFVPGDMYWLFVIIRSFVGIGEASYSCVAPTIIGDLFASEKRTKMLGIFYLAVPVGSGMGYILGSNIAQIFGNWQWALRLTPALGAFCVLLLIFFVQEPKRGGAEGSSHEKSKSNIFEDAIYLCKNKTFVWVTIGFTFATFVLGGLSWWVPTYVNYAIYSKNQEPFQIPLLFGIITCFSGLFGVAASSVLSPKLRLVTKKADPLICALGSLIAVPTLYVIILITRTANPILFWFLVCISISAMCLSWTVVADILLYVVHPTKRSIASALNILFCHLFGDAFSPYVIGAISDTLRAGKPDTYYNRFASLQTALYAGPFFALFSFGAYLFAALYVDEDKKKVDLLIKKSQKSLSSLIPYDKKIDSDENGDSTNDNTVGFNPQVLMNNVNENEPNETKQNHTYNQSLTEQHDSIQN